MIHCPIDLSDGTPANQVRGARAPRSPGKTLRGAGQNSNVTRAVEDIAIASSVSLFRERIREFARIRKGLVPRGQSVLLEKERKNIE